jgi:hypothetical protein
MNAHYNFRYGNLIHYWLEKRSLSLFNVQIHARYSTVDEYLIELEKEKY